GGRLIHLFFQLANDLIVFTIEKQFRMANIPLVILLGNQTDTGAGATFDLVLQAGARTIAIKTVVTLADTKGFLQKDQAFPHRIDTGIGAKILAFFLFGAAVKTQPRIGLSRRKVDVGIGFVIPQQHIVRWAILFDKVLFENQGF